jgi:hypothetical protein
MFGNISDKRDQGQGFTDASDIWQWLRVVQCKRIEGEGGCFTLLQDDLLHPILGGNKMRKLDALLPAIQAEGYTDLVRLKTEVCRLDEQWAQIHPTLHEGGECDMGWGGVGWGELAWGQADRWHNASVNVFL